MENKVMLITGILTLLILMGGVFIFSNDSKGESPAIELNLEDEMKNNITNKTYASVPEMQIDQSKKYTATMKTNKGEMKFELFANETPNTVNSFVFLSKDSFYDGVKFHRIMKDFMIQSGDPKGDGTGGPGYKFDDESITRDYERGILAMANSGPNTNGSQFFIMHADTSLPKNYVIFGKLLEGEEVLDAIANVEVEDNGMGELSKPKEEVIINKVEIAEE